MLDSYDQVWNDGVLGGQGCHIWYWAMIKITIRDEKEGPWTTRALQLDGTLGKYFEVR